MGYTTVVSSDQLFGFGGSGSQYARSSTSFMVGFLFFFQTLQSPQYLLIPKEDTRDVRYIIMLALLFSSEVSRRGFL